jgi:hypothetical protein
VEALQISLQTFHPQLVLLLVQNVLGRVAKTSIPLTIFVLLQILSISAQANVSNNLLSIRSLPLDAKGWRADGRLEGRYAIWRSGPSSMALQ